MQPGDVAEYERCRALVLDASESPASEDFRPNFSRDYRKGAAGG